MPRFVTFIELSLYLGKMKIVLYTSILLFLASFQSQAKTAESAKDSLELIDNVGFKYQSTFSSTEKERIENLLNGYAYYCQKCLGKYPFDLNFYVSRIESSRRPLGFCQAKFGEDVRGVYLPMDLRWKDEDFLSMWQIPHEVSHLALPALGKSKRWFFEGFATYMSHEIMKEMGLYDATSLDAHYKESFEAVRDDFQGEETFHEALLNHQDSRHYTQFYRGGAVYFYRANRALKRKYDTNILAIVNRYQKERKPNHRTVQQVITSWDDILGAPLFSTLMGKLRNNSAKQVMEAIWEND